MIKNKMEIKIPKKLNLLGETFKIKFKGNTGCHGEINFIDRIITLDPKLKKNKEQLIWVFAHEASHFFYSYYYNNHVLGEDKGNEIDEEMFANALSNLFFSILKQIEGDKK